MTRATHVLEASASCVILADGYARGPPETIRIPDGYRCPTISNGPCFHDVLDVLQKGRFFAQFFVRRASGRRHFYRVNVLANVARQSHLPESDYLTFCGE